uniref:Immunoglobulin V-set domain-containing protein n=1 Tax=Xenopus tropicalis TaxID=8364 RepID=A0A803J580_XENTR
SEQPLGSPPLLLLFPTSELTNITVGGGYGKGEGQYCVDQPSGLEAFAGDSVTFPCSFVFPRTVTGITNVAIILHAGGGNYCGARIYNSGYGNTTQGYQGRVSLVGDPWTRNGTITLTNVTTSDIKSYCCRVRLLIPNKETEQWQNGRGTWLTQIHCQVEKSSGPKTNPSVFINCLWALLDWPCWVSHRASPAKLTGSLYCPYTYGP